MAVEITRREMSSSEAREAAARSRDANATRRMLALALVLEGHSREEAARMCGMDRQTLRDWVHRYNGPVTDGASIEIWFGDEARVGQQGTLTRVWAPQGSRPRAPRDRGYTSALHLRCDLPGSRHRRRCGDAGK